MIDNDDLGLWASNGLGQGKWPDGIRVRGKCLADPNDYWVDDTIMD